MEETLTATQIAARIGISERTALRWIAEKKLPAQLVRHGHYLVNSNDIAALAPIAYSQIIESRLIDMERRINDLEAKVGEMEAKPTRAAAPARTLRPAPIPYSISGDEKGIPSARRFAESHGVTRWRIEGQIKAGAFTTTGVQVDRTGRIVQSLNQEQQAAVIAYWDSIRLAYTHCPDCPHKLLPE